MHGHNLGQIYSTQTWDEQDPDDDGLGYYADGVKRTLTDEQIEIFRHSEIQTFLRERRLNTEDESEKDENDVDDVLGGTSGNDATVDNVDVDKETTGSSDVPRGNTEGEVDQNDAAQRETSGALHGQVNWLGVHEASEQGQEHEHEQRTADRTAHVFTRRIITYDD